jgi:hypothetical protein
MKKFAQRFEELNEQLRLIETTKTVRTHHDRTYDVVNREKFDEWIVKVKTLLGNACGKDSEHYKSFNNIDEYTYHDTFETLLRHRAVFNAAKEDYLGGYCNTLKNIIEAEVFESQIEQAEELLGKGYYVPAAVIAGVVLETHIRELCLENNMPTGKLNKMNDDLAKNGIYNVIIQKQITELAAIRNSAAHGKENDEKEGFTLEQVKTMIAGIKNILLITLN